MTNSVDIGKAKKRSADKITPEIIVDDEDDEDDTAKMLQELYDLRKKKLANGYSTIDPIQQLKDSKIVTLDEFKVNGKNDKKWLYLSKLLYYTKNQYRDCMITFNAMMHEDLCEDAKNSKWTLEAAFMTTYGYEIELLEPLLKSNVWLVLANDLELGSGLNLIEQEFQGYPNFTLIHPPKVTDHGLPGIFHPKLWLLKFPSMLRVVVSSGNLYTGAWSICSNCIWFQDFPLKQDKEASKKETCTGFDFNKDFKETLQLFVQGIIPWKIDYKPILKIDLNDYLYENVDVILIPSLPGHYWNQAMNKYGIAKINYVLGKFPCQNSTTPNRKIVNYQATSLGQVDKKYLWDFAASVLPGFKTLKELEIDRKTYKKLRRDKVKLAEYFQKKIGFGATDRVRFIYPTEKYVESCVTGAESAGCLFLKKELYEHRYFPKKIFYQFEASGIIPHSKIFIVTDDDHEVNDNTVIYFGSHNFSPAAWGKYEKKFTQLAVINSEIGVLIPPMKGTAERKKYLVESLPFKLPPKKYEETDQPFIKDKKSHSPADPRVDSGFILLEQIYKY